jgi:hypothetical protein
MLYLKRYSIFIFEYYQPLKQFNHLTKCSMKFFCGEKLVE